MYLPQWKMSPTNPQMNVSKPAGWKALSSLSVLIIRFLTALLIVDHIACLQLEYLLHSMICLACRFSSTCSTLYGTHLLMNGGDLWPL